MNQTNYLAEYLTHYLLIYDKTTFFFFLEEITAVTQNQTPNKL